MTRAVRNRRVKSKRAPIPNPRRVRLNIEHSWLHSKATSWDKAAHEVEYEDAVELDDFAAGEGGHLQQEEVASTGSSTRERSPRRAGAAPMYKAGSSAGFSARAHEGADKWEHGGTVMPNPGQGDCLFHAVVQALRKKDPNKRRSRCQLRAFAVATLRQKAAV